MSNHPTPRANTHIRDFTRIPMQPHTAEFCRQLERELSDANRSAQLDNPLHDVLDEMDSRGGNAIRKLAAYIRACDPERKEKALIAFRDDLECYDRKLTPIGIPATILPPTTETEP